MGFPLKFKDLLETSADQVEFPDYVWINYAVCGCEKDSCGWEGWILDVAGKINEDGSKIRLNADDDQVCPNCGKQLYRTDISIKCKPFETFDISKIDYEIIPMEYDPE